MGREARHESTLTRTQIFRPARIPNHEEEQPIYPNPHPRGTRHFAKGLRSLWYALSLALHHIFQKPYRNAVGGCKANTATTEFGKEKAESLAGLSDKEIEDKVAKLVKSDA